MTVAQLIAILRRLPQEATIVVMDDGEVDQFVDPNPRPCDSGVLNLFGDQSEEMRDGSRYIRL